MKVLNVKRDLNGGRTISISNASILTKRDDPKAVLLEISGSVYEPDAYYLKEHSHDFGLSIGQCAGIIDATDDELQVLTDVGYHIPDLRKMSLVAFATSLENK
jgi:hypothetical protein